MGRNKNEAVLAQDSYRVYRQRVRREKQQIRNAARFTHRCMEFSEIAQILGVSREEVRQLFHSAMKKIRIGFAERGITQAVFDEMRLYE